MPRSLTYLLIAALGLGSALTLVACGGEDAELLPGETAREITANLDTVQQLADEGDCVGAESAAQQVSEQIEALGGVDAKLKEALREGANRLNQVVPSCEDELAETTRPEPEPTEVEDTPEDEEREEEIDQKEREKEEAKQEKDEEKSEKEEEREPPEPPSHAEPPGPEKEVEGEGGQGEGGSPSGGVSPGNAVEGPG